MAELLTDINFQRIKWCCNEYGMGYEELADKLRMPGLLKAVNNDSKGLTYKQLRIIANFFGRGTFFFFEEDPVSAKTGYSDAFRALARKMPKPGRDLNLLIRLVDQYREIYMELSGDIERYYEVESRPWQEALAKRKISSPAALAKAARAWLGVDATKLSFNYLRNLVESRGILVFLTTSQYGQRLLRLNPSSSIRSFSLYSPKTPTILIRRIPNHRNGGCGDSAQAIALMHELGHLLLHKDSFVTLKDFIFSKGRKAVQANEFAINLLVPSSQLRLIGATELKGKTGKQMESLLMAYSNDWGVNSMVIALRLYKENMITRQQFSSYVRLKGTSYESESQPLPKAVGSGRNRVKETVAMFGRRYIATILDAYSFNYISVVKACTFLGYLQSKHLSSDLHRALD